MEEPTQMVEQLEGSEEGASPITAHPVGYLRVCAQKELCETDWPIAQGETVVGRDDQCDLCIPAKSLSRQHVIILVEGETHFIQDLGSRNKTYRNEVQLRPNTFYELTNGCEVLLADVKCQYFIGDPPVGVTSTDVEQTQAYEFEGAGSGSPTLDVGPSKDWLVDFEPKQQKPTGSPKETTTAAAAEVVDSEGSTVGGDDDVGDWENNCEPTQAYPLDERGVADEDERGVADEDEGGVADEDMDCEATVAYNAGDDVTQSDEETSPASSPLLAGGRCDPTVPYPPHPDTDDDDLCPTVGVPSESAAPDNEDLCPTVGVPSTSESAAPVKSKRKGKRVFFEDSDSDQSVELKESIATSDAIDNKAATKAKKIAVANAAISSDVEPPTADRPEAGKKRVCFEDVADSDQTIDVDDTIDGSKEIAEPSTEEKPAIADGESTGETSAGKKTVSFQVTETESDDTQPYEGDGGDTPDYGEPTRKDQPIGFESTVAYDLEENREDSIAAARSIADPTVPYFLEESKEEGLESTTMEGEKSDLNGSRGEEPEAVSVEDAGSTSDAIQSTEPPEVAMETGDDVGSETRDSQQSSGSDFTDTLPEIRLITKQKTLFAKQRGRRGRGGRGGARRGGRASLIDSDSDVAVPKGKGKRGRGGRRGKGASKKTSVVSEVAATISDGDASTTTLDENAEGDASTTLLTSPMASITKPNTSTAIATPAIEGTSATIIATPTVRETSATEIKSLGSDSADTCEPMSSKRSPARTKTSKSTSPSDVLLEESPDLSLPRMRDNQSDHSSVTSSSTTPAGSSSGSPVGKGGGRRGRGRGRGRGRSSTSPRTKPAVKSETTLRHKHPTPEKEPSATDESLHVMFTGVVDKDGERTIRQLGGQLVDSVYDCTHLVTDKVRRTVKFLCCLSRGCHIVNTSWLDKCRAQRRLLPAKDFIIKDRAAERQHNFSLTTSHERAKMSPLLAGYKVFLTSNIRPEKKEMTDIIKCSGGEVLDSLPHAAGEGIVIVTCEKDLGLCSDAVNAGVPVHSTELILGGVLRQELNFPLTSLSSSSSSEEGTGESTSAGTRKRKGKEAASSQPAAKRRKKQ